MNMQSNAFSIQENVYSIICKQSASVHVEVQTVSLYIWTATTEDLVLNDNASYSLL